MTHVQHGWFIDLIYDHPEVFSLHDENLGFCEQIKHTIPMTMERPVYLLHHTIPPQLQGKVHKCLDIWLQQGIIRPIAKSLCIPGGDSTGENWRNLFMYGLP